MIELMKKLVFSRWWAEDQCEVCPWRRADERADEKDAKDAASMQRADDDDPLWACKGVGASIAYPLRMVSRN